MIITNNNVGLVVRKHVFQVHTNVRLLIFPYLSSFNMYFGCSKEASHCEDSLRVPTSYVLVEK